MSSSASKVPTSEWERNKDLIVELYRSKTLRDVRVEMQSQHGFEASSREYEVQLKRWNIRKNATRKEWQQYFAANKDRSITTLPVTHGTGSIFPSVILNKSTASKKRASRWASGNRASSITSQISRSTLPGNKPHSLARLVPNEPHWPENFMGAGVPDAALNIASSSTEFLTSRLRIDRSVGSTWPPHDVETPPGPSQGPVPNANELVQFMGIMPASLHVYSPTVVPDSISPFLGQNSPGRAVFTSLGVPAENNMFFFSMLKDKNSRNELPSIQLEHILRSKGIALDQASGNAVLGGFATKIVAGILTSYNHSMTRQDAHLQRILRNLGSQIPGEGSGLITDDQAFETKFARVLIFSILNGFAGLSDVPMENILRFLNRFIINRLLLDILKQCPQYVSRTLSDNIFRAAIEAKDGTVLNLLLSHKLINVNETVCVYDGEKNTPIARAAVLRSPQLVKSLIDAGANVRGSPGVLINNIKNYIITGDKQPTIPPGSYKILDMLFSAGAKAHPSMMFRDTWCRGLEPDYLISQNIDPESHQDFFRDETRQFRRDPPVIHVAREFEDFRATKAIQKVIDLCRESSCNNCLANHSGPLRDAVIDAASRGKLETVQLLLERADLKAELSHIFRSAIKSHSQPLINFILSLGPELDPPAVAEESTIDYLDRFSTPISEALRSGNSHLLRELEQSGCLDHIHENDRFQALIEAAAEAGNVAYMRDLLARAVTSKEACRELGAALILALREGHQDIVQMLLEAGATFPAQWPMYLSPVWVSIIQALDQREAQILHDLIASGAYPKQLRISQAHIDRSAMVDMAHEYPDLRLDDSESQVILTHLIGENALESLKKLLQHLQFGDSPLEDCLNKAVEVGNVDLIEYLLDVGANPFDDRVLRNVIPDQPHILRRLFQTERQRRTVPKCIGASMLGSVMADGAGNAEALDELIKTGAINFARLEVVVKERRPIQFTPLGMAIQGVPGRFDSDLGAMRKLLDAGADPDGISKSNHYWTQGSPLMTALMVAIETGLEEAVNMLLDHGADIDARPRIRTTRTALQYAAELGNTNMVHLLIRRGADVNSTASSRGGATALQFAAMAGNCNLVAFLLDHGVQLDALPSKIDGMWPLEGAAANGRLDMIRYLWELNVRAVAAGEFPGGFSERHCLRAMNFARENGHVGCRDLISELTGIAVQRLETDEYGAPWIAY